MTHLQNQDHAPVCKLPGDLHAYDAASETEQPDEQAADDSGLLLSRERGQPRAAYEHDTIWRSLVASR